MLFRIEASRSAFQKGGFCADDDADFTGLAENILDDYSTHFGAEASIDYYIRKRFGRIELKIFIAGEKYNPFEEGDDAEEKSAEKTLRHLLLDRTSTINYSYHMGRNIITICSSVRDREKLEIKSPMLWAVILGLAAGLVCQYLPEDICMFLTEELATPVFSVVLGLLTGTLTYQS